MRNLLQPTDLERLLAPLRGSLRREVTIGGRRMTALAEADLPEGGGVCAAVANAQAAELLAQPAIRDADPGLLDGVLDFVMAMADQPQPSRRAGIGGVEVVSEDPGGFDIRTPFHRYTGDLSRGVVRQHLLGVPTLTPPVLHSANLVEFRIGRHRRCVDVEDGIAAFALTRQGDSIMLMHETPIGGATGWLRAREVPAGRLRYEYAITAGSPVLRLTVTFTAGAMPLHDLRLTTAVDAMSVAGLELAEAEIGTATATGTGWRRIPPPAGPGLFPWAEAEPVAHIALGAEGWPEDAPSLHLRPAQPGAIVSLKAETPRAGVLHWLILRHGRAELLPGQSLVVREERLLALGMRGEAAARALAGPDAPGLDLDPLPPSGAALNAVATVLLLDAADAYATPLSAPRRATLAAWMERHAARLAAGPPGLEDLAYATLAMEAASRVTGADASRDRLDDFTARILARQGRDGAFRDAGGAPPTLPAHALALLALARAWPHRDAASPLAGAIAAGLAALSPGMVPLSGAGDGAVAEGLVLAGAGPQSAHRFAEGLGLLTRAAGAVVLACRTTPDGKLNTQARALHRQAIALVRPLVQPRGAGFTVSPSPFGGMATPAAQAAVTLALMAPDAALPALPA